MYRILGELPKKTPEAIERSIWRGIEVTEGDLTYHIAFSDERRVARFLDKEMRLHSPIENTPALNISAAPAAYCAAVHSWVDEMVVSGASYRIYHRPDDTNLILLGKSLDDLEAVAGKMPKAERVLEFGYYSEGKLHRTDGPAKILDRPDGVFLTWAAYGHILDDRMQERMKTHPLAINGAGKSKLTGKSLQQFQNWIYEWCEVP